MVISAGLVWIAVAVWVVCGFLAYGIEKAAMRNFYIRSTYKGYDARGEAVCWYFVLTGLIGLLAALLICCVFERKFGFCLHMPKELCKPRRPK